MYSVACTLVNCSNCYEKKEFLPELVQLAKFSKQHVPEQHPKVKTGQEISQSMNVYRLTRLPYSYAHNHFVYQLFSG